MLSHLRRAAFLLTVATSAVAAAQHEADRTALLAGVGRLNKPDWPAILVVWGTDAFPYVTVKSDGNTQFASAVAATYGKGRVVALGYPLAAAATDKAIARLHANAVRWVAPKVPSPRVAIIGGPASKALPGSRAVSGQDLASKLSAFDVVVVCSEKIGDAGTVQSLREFVRNGGGLLVSVLGFQYAWDHPEVRFAAEYAPNALLEPMGLAYTDNNGYAPDERGAAFLDSVDAPTQLKRLLSLAHAKDPLDKAAANQANAMVVDASRYADPSSPFSKDLDGAVKGVGDVAINPKQPLTWKEPLKRLAVVVKANAQRRLAADRIKKDPNADTFPGPVPQDAPRIDAQVVVQVDYPQWASTGLYVPAGEVATVRIPSELAGKGVVAQIGCHNSPIVINDSWSRSPMLVMQWPLRTETTKIASPYGGLLYLVIPDGIRLPRERIEVRHVVRAPYYRRGETPLYEWQTVIRNYPGAYAEFASDRITLTVPTSIARKIDNPEELMQLWDRMMDLYVDLGMRKLPLRGERVVSDQQIAYGYMYAGYPIMTFLDAADFGTNAKFLVEKGSWGHVHEIGHNQQQPDWTFDGTGEVTNNIFSLYLCEKISNQPVSAWLAKEMPKVKKHIEAGAPFDKWKSDPFLALAMYAQVQQAFGWEAFQKVFREYRDLAAKDRPKTDDEKRDQWLVRLSTAVGRNLGPFFQVWGVPTSAKARESVGALPVWLPEGIPVNPHVKNPGS